MGVGGYQLESLIFDTLSSQGQGIWVNTPVYKYYNYNYLSPILDALQVNRLELSSQGHGATYVGMYV